MYRYLLHAKLAVFPEGEGDAKKKSNMGGVGGVAGGNIKFFFFGKLNFLECGLLWETSASDKLCLLIAFSYCHYVASSKCINFVKRS